VTVGHSAAREALDRAVAAYRSATPGSAALYRKANSFLLGGDQAPWPHPMRFMFAVIFEVQPRKHVGTTISISPNN